MTMTTIEHPLRADRGRTGSRGPAANCEHQRLAEIFTEFLGKLRAGQLTAASPPPAPRYEPRTLPAPGPARRYLRLVHPPQLSDERWELLSASQGRALRLVRRGQEWAALETLRLGTWRHPEEELRQLLIFLHARRRRAAERKEAA